MPNKIFFASQLHASPAAPSSHACRVGRTWEWTRFIRMLEERCVPGHARREAECARRFEEEALSAEETERLELIEPSEEEVEDCWEESDGSDYY